MKEKELLRLQHVVRNSALRLEMLARRVGKTSQRTKLDEIYNEIKELAGILEGYCREVESRDID